MRRALAASIVLSLAPACTALVRPLELVTCQADADCEALRDARDEPSTCHPYACRAGRCVRHPAEVCDGLDNDCDAAIDEGAIFLEDGRGVLLGGLAVGAHVPGPELLATLSADGDVAELLDEAGTRTTVSVRTSPLLSTTAGTPVAGCWGTPADPDARDPSCRPTRVVLAPRSGLALHVAPSGAVRPAWREGSVLSIPAADGVVFGFRGLASTACPGCAARGAAIVATGVARTTGIVALVRSPDPGTARCPSPGSLTLEVAAVHAVTDDLTGVTHVTASAAGTTELVGPSGTDAAPMLLELPGVEGAVLAYGDELGRLRLGRVLPTDPPADALPTPPLGSARIELLPAIDDGAPALGDAAVASAVLDAEHVALFFVWTTPCPTEAEPPLHARRVVVRTGGGRIVEVTPDPAFVVADGISIDGTRRLERAPAFAVGEVPRVLATDEPGGWLVAWYERFVPPRLTVSRIAATDGRVVDDSFTIPLVDPGGEPLSTLPLRRSVAVLGGEPARVVIEGASAGDAALWIGALCGTALAP